MARSIGITLDASSAKPLYQQIASSIATRIRSGALPAGYRLPPTRSLATELATHRNTVVRAYEELVEAGLTVSVVGRGTFVAEHTPARETAAEQRGGELPWGSLVSRAAAAEPLRRVDRLARSVIAGDTVNLTRMQPPRDLLPHDQMRRCLDHVLRTLGPRALGYAPREGVPRLRELVANQLVRDGVPATAESVMITTGSQQALDLLARALIDPGDTFLVDESTYSGAINILAAAGARLVGVPSDEQGPELATLARLVQSGAKGFYLMPNCGNPSGRTISFERRRQLVDWSRTAGVPLIEDDYGADLMLDGLPPPPAMRTLDGEVVYVGTFSKKLIPALRVGFMVCPDALQTHLVPLKHAMDLGTSALLQHALAEFLERGYLAAHLRRIQPAYRARRDALVAALREHLPPAIHFDVPRTGLVIWLDLPPRLDPEVAFDVAQRHGVLVTPGTLNSATGGGRRPGLRLTFCAEAEARLAEGGRRLGLALTKALASVDRISAGGPLPARIDVV